MHHVRHDVGILLKRHDCTEQHSEYHEREDAPITLHILFHSFELRLHCTVGPIITVGPAGVRVSKPSFLMSTRERSANFIGAGPSLMLTISISGGLAGCAMSEAPARLRPVQFFIYESGV